MPISHSHFHRREMAAGGDGSSEALIPPFSERLSKLKPSRYGTTTYYVLLTYLFLVCAYCDGGKRSIPACWRARVHAAPKHIVPIVFFL